MGARTAMRESQATGDSTAMGESTAMAKVRSPADLGRPASLGHPSLQASWGWRSWPGQHTALVHGCTDSVGSCGL